MGGCVASVMSVKSGFSSHPHEDILKIRTLTKQSVAVSDPTDDASGIYHAFEQRDATLEDINKEYYGGEDISMVARLKRRCAEYKTKNAVAWRSVDHVEKTEITDPSGRKKPWEFTHLKATEYLTYAMLWEHIEAFGEGLRAIGLSAGQNVGLYEETRKEWMIGCYGLWSQSMVGVTVYANLGEDALEYAINEADLNAVICGGTGVANVIAAAKGKSPIFIHIGDIPAGVDLGESKAYSFESVLQKGRESVASGKAKLNFPTTPDDHALIMYTSGTTGDPKGVMLTHGNVYACVRGFGFKLMSFVQDDTSDITYVAYLPLAHILEFGAENVFLDAGGCICYGHPRTLTSVAAKPHGDLEEFRPLFFVGVPRVFDTIKKSVEAKIPSGFKRAIFDRAYQDRLEGYKSGVALPAWDSKVFAAPRAMLGGRCRAIMSGGAPLSAKTQEFMSVIFGCSVGQGYGLTETGANSSIQSFWDLTPEGIGGLLRSCEVKLVDVEEWKHTDPEPRGEIWIRGPVVCKGYYKQEAKTKESFTEDGWFKTGDVGLMAANGTMRIVGRVKSLAKNVFGEYVSMDALEAVYVLNDIVMPNGACVLVNGHKAYIAAIVCTDQAKAMKFAKESGLAGEWPSIIDTPEFRAKAAVSLAKTAKQYGKKPFECVKHVRVVKDEWTPENGIMTAAMKLKRREVEKQYASVITELFVDE